MNKTFIPFRLPGLNEYTRACRASRYAGADMKKITEHDIMPFFNQLEPVKGPVKICFIWHEKNKRRDPDNIAFGKKFILDALVNSGRIEGDSAKYIKGLKDGFSFGEKDGVEVYIKCSQ